jgi:hypothetical protein
MNIRWIGFGAIEIDGKRWDRDVVIDGGRIRKRRKGPSKAYREAFGHTPLSVDEDLPWGGDRMIVGTGASGQLPVMPEVLSEASKRHIEIDRLPTEQACRLLGDLPDDEVYAVLHVTC